MRIQWKTSMSRSNGQNVFQRDATFTRRDSQFPVRMNTAMDPRLKKA